jgi:small-conductance mechanosensitive channel
MDPAIYESILFIAVGIVAAIIVYYLFSFFKKKAGTTKTLIDDLLVQSLGMPLAMLAFFIPFFFAIQHIIGSFPQYAWIATSDVLTAMYILAATWIIATFVDSLLDTYGTAIARRTKSDLDDRIVEIFQKIAKYLIWFTGILYVLSLFKVNITPLIAGAGVAGIAIALAAQDLFSNFFGGAVIITDKPFKIGDRVLINDILGDVVRIGPRSTRIITLDSDIVTIPNNKITTSVVRNFSLPNPQVRILIPVSVAIGTDIQKVRTILLAIGKNALAEKKDFVADNPGPAVFLVKMDKNAMTFELTLYSHEFSYNSIIRDYLNTNIIETFKKEGIAFA